MKIICHFCTLYFNHINLLSPQLHHGGEIDTCAHWLFCGKFNSKKLVLEPFSHIISIFRCSSPNDRALRAAACFVACLGQPQPLLLQRTFFPYNQYFSLFESERPSFASRSLFRGLSWPAVAVALAKVRSIYFHVISTLPALFGAGLYPSLRIFLRDRLASVLVLLFMRFSIPFGALGVVPATYPVPRFCLCVSPFSARYFQFVVTSFPPVVKCRTLCLRCPALLLFRSSSVAPISWNSLGILRTSHKCDLQLESSDHLLVICPLGTGPRIHQSAGWRIQQSACQVFSQGHARHSNGGHSVRRVLHSGFCLASVVSKATLHLPWPLMIFPHLLSDPIFSHSVQVPPFSFVVYSSTAKSQRFFRCYVIRGHHPFLSGVDDSAPNPSRWLRMSKVRPSLIRVPT